MAPRAVLTLSAFASGGMAAAAATARNHAAGSGAVEQSPLRKVVTLLEEMKGQVEKEAAKDQSVYERYACWCKTNDREKTGAIEEATGRLQELSSFVEGAVAKQGELKSEIESLEQGVREDSDALQQAEALRAREKEEFEAQQADMKETLSALNQAIDVLAKVQLLQTSNAKAKDGEEASATLVGDAVSSLVQVRSAMRQRLPQKYRDVMQKDLFDMIGALQEMQGSGQAKLASAFLGETAAPSGAAAGAKSYNSRSGSILGTLSEMKDQFARDLTSLHTTEMTALVQFQKLRAAKLGEIAEANSRKKAKEAELADLMSKTAEAKEDSSALEQARTADEEFLSNLQDGCKKEADEYTARVTTRSEEIRALGETLKILNEDDARDLFGKTMSLLQLNAGDRAVASGSSAASSSESSRSAARAAAERRAVRRLRSAAGRHGNMALSALASRVGIDAFERVKAAMEKMVAQLKIQQKEEYEKNELCKADLDRTEDEIKVKSQEKDDLDSTHLELENQLSTITSSVGELQEDVAAMQRSLKEAGEARKEENAVFQQSIADQRATVNILQKALHRLQAFYNGKDGASFAQVRRHRQEPGAAVPPAPKAPEDYRKSAGAGGVLQLIMKIISDAESTEKEMQVSEQQAQEAYAGLVRDTAASIEADRAAIATKESERAETNGRRSETRETQMANDLEMGKLKELLQAHHASCDWVMQYFDVRQQARQEEMQAIEDAKSILSGANFGA
eukprot:TRINITY_DN14179_c0_g1_i1.p1 TRINITY_DN14179_c0_g1~~TRINITY_DN14179_c0_g1_i1.p1  ORF type:complete len:740 (-),score=236.85 TRINITY_DN14179_c0_g1_i1:83-2302(-)